MQETERELEEMRAETRRLQVKTGLLRAREDYRFTSQSRWREPLIALFILALGVVIGKYFL